MVDLMTGLQTFKIAFDTLNTLSQVKSDTERTLAIANIVGQLGQAQGALVEAHQRELALSNEKSALETEVVRLKDWSAQKACYKLAEHGHHRILAYAFQKPEGSDEPPHSLCPDCFAKGKPSILQTEHELPRAEVLICQQCKWTGRLNGVRAFSDRRR